MRSLSSRKQVHCSLHISRSKTRGRSPGHRGCSPRTTGSMTTAIQSSGMGCGPHYRARSHPANRCRLLRLSAPLSHPGAIGLPQTSSSNGVRGSRNSAVHQRASTSRSPRAKRRLVARSHPFLRMALSGRSERRRRMPRATPSSPAQSTRCPGTAGTWQAVSGTPCRSGRARGGSARCRTPRSRASRPPS